MSKSKGGKYFDSQSTLKIALVGPCKSGKTLMSHLISNRAAVFCSPDRAQDANLYDPTVGVRILSFDEQITARSPDSSKSALLSVQIELWDCSGDQKYEGIWPSITDKVDGVIVIFDPTSREQANEVRVWCDYFARQGNLNNGQLAIFAHGELTQGHKPLTIKGAGDKQIAAPILNVSTKPVENGEVPAAKAEFQNFCGGVFGVVQSVDAFL